MIAESHFPFAAGSVRRQMEAAEARPASPPETPPAAALALEPIVAEIDLTFPNGRRSPAFLFGPFAGHESGDVETRRAVLAAARDLFGDAAVAIRRFYAAADAPGWRLRAAPKVVR